MAFRPNSKPSQFRPYCSSDSLDEIESAIEQCRSALNDAEAAITAADDADDMPAYDAANALFLSLDDDLLLLQQRRDELEEEASFAQAREARAAYWGSVL